MCVECCIYPFSKVVTTDNQDEMFNTCACKYLCGR